MSNIMPFKQTIQKKSIIKKYGTIIDRLNTIKFVDDENNP